MYDHDQENFCNRLNKVYEQKTLRNPLRDQKALKLKYRYNKASQTFYLKVYNQLYMDLILYDKGNQEK